MKEKTVSKSNFTTGFGLLRLKRFCLDVVARLKDYREKKGKKALAADADDADDAGPASCSLEIHCSIPEESRPTQSSFTLVIQYLC